MPYIILKYQQERSEGPAGFATAGSQAAGEVRSKLLFKNAE